MQTKFNSFQTIYEKDVSGTIHKVSGNFAFLLTNKSRLVFIHINNVLLSYPNTQVKFVDALVGQKVLFDIVLDNISGKPSAINLTLGSNMLLDSLPF